MIAVTGATGLLGSSIVRRLVEAHHPVIAIKRSGSDTSSLDDMASKITWRDAAVEDVVAMQEALQDATVVIHTAAVVSFNPRDKNKIYATNVIGTQNVVNICLEQKVKKLIHISSVAAIGRPKGITNITESQKWIESPYNSAYGQSKYLAELEVVRGQEEGLDTVMINPSVILGAVDWNKSSSVIFKYIWKQRPFYIEGNLNYVSVRDVVKVVMLLLESTISGERFIVSAGTISYYDIFERIAKKFGKNKPSIKIGGKGVGALAELSTFFSNITRTEPIITRELARATAHSVHFDNAKVKTLLDLQFEPLEETLEWCCTHYAQKAR